MKGTVPISACERALRLFRTGSLRVCQKPPVSMCSECAAKHPTSLLSARSVLTERRKYNSVPTTGFGLVECFVGCFQGFSGVFVRKDVRNPAGKRDPANGIVIGPVDELATAKVFSDCVELFPSLLGCFAPEKHDELFAAMSCDMAIVV